MDSVSFIVIDREKKEHPFEIPTDMGLNLMEIIKENNISEEEIGICGGMALCASCQVYVQDPSQKLQEKSEAEEKMLEEAFHVKANSRLACQIQIAENIKDMVFELAPI